MKMFEFVNDDHTLNKVGFYKFFQVCIWSNKLNIDFTTILRHLLLFTFVDMHTSQF